MRESTGNERVPRHRRIITASIVLTLGLGLHVAFRSLASQLPQVFPHLAREIPSKILEVEPTLTAAALSPEREEPVRKEPPARIVMKKSGVQAIDDRAWKKSSLVRSNPIPLLPTLEGRESQGVDFPVPASIVPAVEFWKKIYGYYDTNQVVIHDDRYFDIQYSVLDFHDLAKDTRRTDKEKKVIRESEVAREIKRIEELVDDPDARKRVRAQGGLRDKFLEGVERSGRYLSLFEEIFEGYGLPPKLTRLVFVESIFKERAFSKVGAAGLWQFMPSTGRKYLRIDRLVDERYDPILATHAAAKLMRRNFELLGSWPLAISAYNAGAGHLQRAVKKLGTSDIGKIIWYYGNSDYAFASRNFYPEFLAAFEIVENEERYFGRVLKHSPMEFDLVEIPVTLTLPEIAALSGVSIETLQELHPAFAPSVFDDRYALPAGSEIRLPRGTYPQMELAHEKRF